MSIIEIDTVNAFSIGLSIVSLLKMVFLPG